MRYATLDKMCYFTGDEEKKQKECEVREGIERERKREKEKSRGVGEVKV